MNPIDLVSRGIASWGSRRLPRYIVVESTNKCNLRCPVCATANNMKRDRGEMSVELFRELLRQLDWKIKMINFGYSGEPLLNRNLFLLIKLAKAKGINSGFDTNGFFVGDFVNDIIEAKTSYINISIDGASQESLVKYRRGGDFERIVRGIRRLCSLKASLKLREPFICLQFLLMKHNENELGFVKTLARECAVDELRLKTFNTSLGLWLSATETDSLLAQFEPENKLYSRYRKNRRGGRVVKKRFFCIYPFTSPVILYNGDVSLCCLDFNGENIVGNIKKETLKTIWRSFRYNSLRAKALTRSLSICKNCSFGYSENKKIIF